MLNEVGSFPFGQPIRKVCQADRTPKKVFILGVYASAVHARWVDENGKTLIRALAVASEPEIFWRGEDAVAAGIVKKVVVPEGAGKLMPAAKALNGPSGTALDECFLNPMGLEDRSNVWLCDLVPYSCCNERQGAALDREYQSRMKTLKLPEYLWPGVPSHLTDDKRLKEILTEFREASPSMIITLGDQPLKWFISNLCTKTSSRLVDYGNTPETYGRLHDISVDGRSIKLLPLVHPRKAGKLGSHSQKWADFHELWTKYTAPSIMKQIERKKQSD